jgi:hypothetical protein
LLTLVGVTNNHAHATSSAAQGVAAGDIDISTHGTGTGREMQRTAGRLRIAALHADIATVRFRATDSKCDVSSRGAVARAEAS